MGITGSSSIDDSSSMTDTTTSIDDKTIERKSTHADASIYFSRSEREILEKVYSQLRLPTDADQFNNILILTLGSYALEATSRPAMVEQNVISSHWQRSFDSPDDVEDLLSQLKLSSLHDEKKKSYLDCLAYLENEVLPKILGKYLLFQSSPTNKTFSILSSQNSFNHFVAAWLGRHGEEDEKINFIFELAQLHHPKPSLPSCTEFTTSSIVDSSELVDCYTLLDFLYRFAFAEAILRHFSYSDSSSISPLPPFRSLQRSHFLVNSIKSAPNVMNGNISTTAFNAWCKSYCPNMLSSFYRVTPYVFFPPVQSEAVPHSLLYFDAHVSKSSFFTSSVCPTLYALACAASTSRSLFQGVRKKKLNIGCNYLFVQRPV